MLSTLASVAVASGNNSIIRSSPTNSTPPLSTERNFVAALDPSKELVPGHGSPPSPSKNQLSYYAAHVGSSGGGKNSLLGVSPVPVAYPYARVNPTMKITGQTNPSTLNVRKTRPVAVSQQPIVHSSVLSTVKEFLTSDLFSMPPDRLEQRRQSLFRNIAATWPTIALISELLWMPDELKPFGRRALTLSSNSYPHAPDADSSALEYVRSRVGITNLRVVRTLSQRKAASRLRLLKNLGFEDNKFFKDLCNEHGLVPTIRTNTSKASKQELQERLAKILGLLPYSEKLYPTPTSTTTPTLGVSPDYSQTRTPTPTSLLRDESERSIPSNACLDHLTQPSLTESSSPAGLVQDVHLKRRVLLRRRREDEEASAQSRLGGAHQSGSKSEPDLEQELALDRRQLKIERRQLELDRRQAELDRREAELRLEMSRRGHSQGHHGDSAGRRGSDSSRSSSGCDGSSRGDPK